MERPLRDRVESNEDGWLVDVVFKCEGFLQGTNGAQVPCGSQGCPSVGIPSGCRSFSLKQGEEAQLIVSRWRTEFDDRWDQWNRALPVMMSGGQGGSEGQGRPDSGLLRY